MSYENPWAKKNKRQRARDGRANNQPPEHTRFQPGSSGNPKGRPKGSVGQAAMLRNILNEMVELREGSRLRKISKFEAVHRTLVHNALKGDSKAFKTLRDMVEEDPPSPENLPLVQFIFDDLTPEERRELIERRAARNKSESNPLDK